MPLLYVTVGVLILIFLIMKLKLNTFFSLIIVSFIVALLLGIPLEDIGLIVENGLGSTLGHIALIFGLGAMLGKLIADAGGANRIAMTLINKFGKEKIHWAVVIASFIVGIALFYEVAFVLIVPIIFTIAKEVKISIVKLILHMSAALLITHSFLPPHPGITTVANGLGADVGTVLLYGLIISIPCVIIAGVIYPNIAKRIVPSAFEKVTPDGVFKEEKTFKLEETPGFGISVFTAMLPVILLAIAAVIKIIEEALNYHDGFIFMVLRFIGEPSTAMIISLLVAIYTMGIKRNIAMVDLMKSCTKSINSIGMMLLIIGGGGAFKQVIIEGGVGEYIAELFEGSALSPVLFAWIFAAILRISLGSGTVAAISTVGLVTPMLAMNPDVNLTLVTLAIGCGSTICSHVNDAAFWIVKEYSGMTLKETFGTYTVLSTISSVIGLVCTLILDLFV